MTDAMTLEESVAWAILEALHDDVPVMDRPQSWSDLNGNHENKIRRAAKAVIALIQPEYLTGCLHPGNEPLSCQYEGGCQSESCDNWNKTEYRARMTVLAQVDGILYPNNNEGK